MLEHIENKIFSKEGLVVEHIVMGPRKVDKAKRDEERNKFVRSMFKEFTGLEMTDEQYKEYVRLFEMEKLNLKEYAKKHDRLGNMQQVQKQTEI